jgi:2-methylcitrate dehydratase PrpD
MKALAASYLQQGRRGNSWIIGTRQRGAPRDAAYLNGTASTWHDFEEGNIIASSHP